jgi:hypothetical protein
MKVELQSDLFPERVAMDAPVVIVLETPEELEWAYDAFSRRCSVPDSPHDGSRHLRFLVDVNTALNLHASSYRGLIRAVRERMRRRE